MVKMFTLAIESGATSSEVFLLDENDNTKEKKRFGPANYQLMDVSQLETFFREIHNSFLTFSIEAIGVGMPGILDDEDEQCVGKVVRKLWPDVKGMWIGNDLQTALACIEDEYELKVVVVAGTGSCSYGSSGKVSGKVGGYGHRIGDRGSGYALVERGIRLALCQHEHHCSLTQNLDSDEISSAVLAVIMKEIGVVSIKQLVIWMLSAKKEEIASLAPQILLKWKEGDELGKRVVEEMIQDLSADCICLVNKLLATLPEKNEKGDGGSPPNFNIRLGIGLTGSLFTKDAQFADAFKKTVLSQLPLGITNKCSIETLENTALGSVKTLTGVAHGKIKPPLVSVKNSDDCESKEDLLKKEEFLAESILPLALGLSLTEQRNAKSMNLDRMAVEDAIDLMIAEDESIFHKIRSQKKSIGILVDRVCAAFQNGGRLFYVGAGTSGRLGILDATECPPTFRSPQEWVQGIIAGGFSSVSKAKEGAEDSIIDGMKAIVDRNVNNKDIVIGIAACGRTPFVWGSIEQAKSLGAFTAFLTFNTELKLRIEPDLFISMNLGAEVLTGSTRLKCGTATKCVLNILSTLAMVKYGKCFENLMVDLNPANQKLKQRSLRIVLLMTSHAKGISEEEAKEILIQNNYDIRRSVERIRATQAAQGK